jgi:hypothetical protein
VSAPGAQCLNGDEISGSAGRLLSQMLPLFSDRTIASEFLADNDLEEIDRLLSIF